jgi:hypothetical protein
MRRWSFATVIKVLPARERHKTITSEPGLSFIATQASYGTNLANASFAVKQKAEGEIDLSFDRHNATLAPSLPVHNRD